jgi:hypothetical protein
MRVSESSAVVGIYRRARSSSAVVKAIRSWQSRVPLLFRDLQGAGPMASSDERVVQVLADSVLARWTIAMLERLECAARESASGRVIAAAGSRWAAAPLAGRIRLSALTLFTAVVVHLLLTRFQAPEPLPAARATWAAILVVLAVVMAAANGLAAAWRDKSTSRSRNGSEIE